MADAKNPVGQAENKSKVYFMDFRIADVNTDNIPSKLRRLMKKGGFEDLPFGGRFAALKLHFGEPGNLTYLRPNYARVVASYVRELGGMPFVTDCNTLYIGRRKNALDHLDAAYENGFNPFALGCHTIIADGLKGTDEVAVPVPGGKYVKEAKIGRAIMDADIVISMTHFKVHELVGIGGVLKNVGMGCGSRAGKREMHSSGKPQVRQDVCVGCGFCAKNCAHGAISRGPNGKMSIDESKCAGCGRCIGACFKDAVETKYDEAIDVAGRKIVEYAMAVLHGRPQFHLNFAVDIIPLCDCHDSNDIPIVADIGIFASTDPVAADKAVADAVNARPVQAGSYLDGVKSCGDYFKDIHSHVNWLPMLEYAEELGLGHVGYDIVKVD